MNGNRGAVLCLLLAGLTACATAPANDSWTVPAQKNQGDPPGGQPIYILGEVRKPGIYPEQQGADFADYITESHGFTEIADLDHIEILHREGKRRLSREFAWTQFQTAPTLTGGDVVIVHATQRTKFDKKVAVVGTTAAVMAAIATIILAAGL